jgi:hypothetical protein
MLSDHQTPANVNVSLSFEHIQRYFDALPSSAETGHLARKKENAEAAVEYLHSFFDSKPGDVVSMVPCAPRPHLP